LPSTNFDTRIFPSPEQQNKFAVYGRSCIKSQKLMTLNDY